jgi:hypothetical protein
MRKGHRRGQLDEGLTLRTVLLDYEAGQRPISTTPEDVQKPTPAGKKADLEAVYDVLCSFRVPMPSESFAGVSLDGQDDAVS